MLTREIIMMFKASRLLIALLALCCAAGASAAESDCLEDNVEGQLIGGTLSIVDAQDAAGRAERPYILALPETICLTTDDPDTQVDATETVHVYATDPTLAQRIAALVGQFVIVKGRPFAAHTAHHHAPIVLEIREISPN